MSSNAARLVLLAGLVILIGGMIAWAQDRKVGESAGRGAVDIFNSVEGRTVVITSVPEGTKVEKGDVVCALDPSDLRDRLATQEIVVRAAEFDFHGATLAREATGMRIVEYVEGQFRNELAAIAGETKLAEAMLSRSEDHLAWSQRMFSKGYVSLAEKVTDELTLKEARFHLEATQSRRKMLLDYTKDRSLKVLRSEADIAMSRELGKQAALERERLVVKRLQEHIGRCKVTAPTSGRITYGTPIEAGAVVHEGQMLARIVPDGASTTTRPK